MYAQSALQESARMGETVAKIKLRVDERTQHDINRDRAVSPAVAEESSRGLAHSSCHFQFGPHVLDWEQS